MRDMRDRWRGMYDSQTLAEMDARVEEAVFEGKLVAALRSAKVRKALREALAEAEREEGAA